MRTRDWLLVVGMGAVMGLAGCERSNPVHTSRATQQALTRNLIEADRRFALDTEAHGLRVAVHHHFDPEAVLLLDNTRPLRGLSEIEDYFALLTDTAVQLRNAPLHATVSADGELGYTYGYYRLRMPPFAQRGQWVRGTYLMVWRRQSDRVWRVVLFGQTQMRSPVQAAGTDRTPLPRARP